MTELKHSPLKSGFSFGGPLDCALPTALLESLYFTPSEKYPPKTDSYWMLEAFKESLRGIGRTNPNPAVGCILVDRDGIEISRGFTQPYGGLHAERSAFQNVINTQQLEGGTAYVTLEPCSHFGHQPPCVDLLAQSHLANIVISRIDSHFIVNGQGIRKLQEAGKNVRIGCFEKEITAWNFPFFAQLALNRPTVILKWAQTLDGQLVDDSSTSQWISGPMARAYSHWLRQRYDAVLVGGRTLLTDAPRLSVRECKPPHQAQPLPIVLDPKGLCLNLNSDQKKCIERATFTDQRKIVYITHQSLLNNATSSWILKNKNVNILPLNPGDGENPIFKFKALLSQPEISQILGRPLQSVFVEGGPGILSAFLEAGCADLIHTFIAPKITGGKLGHINLPYLLKNALQFETLSTSQLDQDLLIEMVSKEVCEKIF